MKRSSKALLAGPVLSVLVTVAGPAPPASAQAAGHLLVVDVDAGAVSLASAGALFNIDVAATDILAPPIYEASADSGAPFEYLAGVAVSPVDGRAYVADWGTAVPPAVAIPKIFAVDGRTGAVQVIALGAPLLQPFGLTFLPDGRLVVVDWDADPSGIGPDGYGGTGHGALFVIDVPNCSSPPCAVSVLSDGGSHPFGPGVRSAFEDPVGVAYDSVSARLYVVDLQAPSAAALLSSPLYAVDTATGAVSVVAHNLAWTALIAVDVRGDGSPIVVDDTGVVGGSTVWQVDVIRPVTNNATLLTSGIAGGPTSQYAIVEDTAIDPVTDRVYVVDSGEYVGGTFVTPPRVLAIDEGNPDPLTNGTIVNEAFDFVTPSALGFVPQPVATSVSPAMIGAPTNVMISGSHLFPWTSLDFGPLLTVSTVDWAPGLPRGSALQALLTPSALAPTPPGCGSNVSVDLDTLNPFDSAYTLVDAVTVVRPTGGFVPGPPISDKGDATGDGLVDGLDFAILGAHFGAAYCDGLPFENNADFDNDDLIDGTDLAILAMWFGTRP